MAKSATDDVKELTPDEAKALLTKHKRKAADILNTLSSEAREEIKRLVLSRGQNRYTRRATQAIIRRDYRDQARQQLRWTIRSEAREAREEELWLRFEKRHERGIYRPLPGMPFLAYQRILGLYGRAESVKLGGEVIEGSEGALVRVSPR